MKLKSNKNNNQSSLIDNQLEMPSTSVENVLQISYFYAKQTQFTKCPNDRNFLYYNELYNFYQSDESQKQTQSNPIKAKTKPIQTQFTKGQK